MSTSRIEDLKRRIQRDPGSIAFAQLAEEYRRAGLVREAIEACRSGLELHPGYLSARVTLGRSLVEAGDYREADRQLLQVLRLAPDNLVALRAIADCAERRDDPIAALSYYRRALALAPQDDDLKQHVDRLGFAAVGPAAASDEPSAPAPAAPDAPFDSERTRVLATISALERWLGAIAERRAGLAAWKS